jgi:NADPH:quinone reductase-like Zn-dependent oxidoreductase
MRLPRVPGHEVVGRIEETGPNVSKWKIGQRVGVGFMDGQRLVPATLVVETKSTKAQITEKTKATEMLEDDAFSSDPGGTSAQWRHPR